MALQCPVCGANTIQVSMAQTSASTRTRKRGCLWSLIRLILIVGTLGLWLLVGKSKSKSKTKITNTKTAICQSCGNSWTL